MSNKLEKKERLRETDHETDRQCDSWTDGQMDRSDGSDRTDMTD
jgi:hypothetical protein